MAGYSPRRRRAELGQHFLRGDALAAELVDLAPLSQRDLVIEIGPGTGVLTRALARREVRVRAIEIDPRFVALLRDEFAHARDVEIVEGDFLEGALPAEPYLILGNIPFARTAEIVRRLIDAAHPPRDALLIVQRAAAERYVGHPYAGESLRSLLLKPWWHVEIARTLPPRVFDPPPAVDAAVLSFARRPRPLVEDRHAASYRAFVTNAFGQHGQAAGAALRRVFTRTELVRLGRELGFDARRSGGDPPSALTFDQWLALFRASRSLRRPPQVRR